MEEKRANHIEPANDDQPEDCLRDPVAPDKTQAWNRSDNLMQGAVAIKDDRVVIPSLSRPEPNPARPAYERADENQQNPHQKAPGEHVHCEPPLLNRVITVAEG